MTREAPLVPALLTLLFKERTNIQIRLLFTLLLTGSAMLSGCLTMSGNYETQAYDQTGKRLDPNIVWYAEGRHIYTVRNALCSLIRMPS